MSAPEQKQQIGIVWCHGLTQNAPDWQSKSERGTDMRKALNIANDVEIEWRFPQGLKRDTKALGDAPTPGWFGLDVLPVTLTSSDAYAQDFKESAATIQAFIDELHDEQKNPL